MKIPRPETWSVRLNRPKGGGGQLPPLPPASYGPGNPGRRDNFFSYKHFVSPTRDDFLRATYHVASGFWSKND